MAPDEACSARADPDHTDGRDDEREARRELEERRPVQRAWFRRRAPLLDRFDRVGRRQRNEVVAVLDDRAKLGAALGREQQWLGACADHAVPALELAAVDSEVGLVDELVRVESVLREAGNAERHGRADRLGRRFDLELALGDGATDSLRDLQRLLRRRFRQEDRELLPAEASRNVVVPELRAEDLGDALQHRVAGEMAVAVVDVSQQVEVGHDQRHRPLEARRARDLPGKHRREVPRVVEARLGVDTGLRLQLGHAERPVHDDEGRERREDQPGIPIPERGERDAEDREHDVDRDALGPEEAGLPEAVAPAELEDDRDENVVHGDERDRGRQTGECEARVRVRDDARAVPRDQVGDPPRRERVERVIRDVEALDGPRVALLQPLGDGLHERDQHDQLGRQQAQEVRARGNAQPGRLLERMLGADSSADDGFLF